MQNINFQDYLACKTLAFEWADSIDKKDWDRLQNILAPNLLVDYTMIGQPCFPDMGSDAFISMMNSPDLVGDPLVHTQHLLGGVSYEYISEDEITAIHQIRAAHQRYADDTLATVAHQAHGYGRIQHWYKRIGGTWKLAGLRPEMYWSENELSKIFPRQGLAS